RFSRAGLMCTSLHGSRVCQEVQANISRFSLVKCNVADLCCVQQVSAGNASVSAQNIPFSPAEYARRIAKTRAAMAEAGIDALFVTDPSNQAWLTGYDGWS